MAWRARPAPCARRPAAAAGLLSRPGRPGRSRRGCVEAVGTKSTTRTGTACAPHRWDRRRRRRSTRRWRSHTRHRPATEPPGSARPAPWPGASRSRTPSRARSPTPDEDPVASRLQLPCQPLRPGHVGPRVAHEEVGALTPATVRSPDAAMFPWRPRGARPCLSVPKPGHRQNVRLSSNGCRQCVELPAMALRTRAVGGHVGTRVIVSAPATSKRQCPWHATHRSAGPGRGRLRCEIKERLPRSPASTARSRSFGVTGRRVSVARSQVLPRNPVTTTCFPRCSTNHGDPIAHPATKLHTPTGRYPPLFMRPSMQLTVPARRLRSQKQTGSVRR